MLLNVGCGPHRAPAPWWNIDVVDCDDHPPGCACDTHPDEVVPRGPLPYPDGSCERIYLGHLLEHVVWPCQSFLADIRRVLTTGGELCVVGPDVLRVIEGWRAGREPWSLVLSALEHGEPQEDLGDWPEARHHWNCTETRVVMALESAGFGQVKPVPLDGAHLGTWPVVSYAEWQCAVTARREDT